jgi:hypothetical protein
MDASQSIGNTSLSSSYDDGAGCLDGSVPTTSGSNWLLNMGLQSTLYSSGYVLFRITLPQSYTGQITKITLVGR